MRARSRCTRTPSSSPIRRPWCAAGADVLVHMVQREPIDQEYQALAAAEEAVLGDRHRARRSRRSVQGRSVLRRRHAVRGGREDSRQPANGVGLTAHCAPPSPNAAARERILAQNFPMMIAAGVKLVLATDTGIHPGHTFGSGEHVELARWVQLGLPPAQAIVAATRTPAELMGLTDLGTLAAGKRASFIVLNANPLVNIRNTRIDRGCLPRWREVRSRSGPKEVARAALTTDRQRLHHLRITAIYCRLVRVPPPAA